MANLNDVENATSDVSVTIQGASMYAAVNAVMAALLHHPELKEMEPTNTVDAPSDATSRAIRLSSEDATQDAKPQET